MLIGELFLVNNTFSNTNKNVSRDTITVDDNTGKKETRHKLKRKKPLVSEARGVAHHVNEHQIAEQTYGGASIWRR